MSFLHFSVIHSHFNSIFVIQMWAHQMIMSSLNAIANYLSQLNLLMQRLCNTLFFSFSNAKKYIIKDFKYLIEAPPPKPATAFLRFVSSFTKGNKTGVSASLIVKEKSYQWKDKTPEEKAVFEAPYKAEQQTYKKLKEEYDAKYVTPFKRLNGNGQLIKEVYSKGLVKVENTKDIKEYAKAAQKAVKEIAPQEVQKFKEIAEKGNQERHKLIQKFQFPEKKFKSQAGYTRQHPTVPLHLRASEFEKYEAKWKQDVEQWLKDNKYEIDIKSFLKKYRALEKEKKLDKILKQSIDEEYDECDEQILKEKLTVHKTGPKRTRTGAKRVEKNPLVVSQALLRKRKAALGLGEQWAI